MEEHMIKIQKLCKELNNELNYISEERKQMGEIENDEDRKTFVYYSEKLNDVRSYLVSLSKKAENNKDKMRNEITFYDWKERSS